MSTHILIVNQHGDNRGDEAALLAMLGAFTSRLGDVRFSLVHQFRDPELPIDYGPHQVRAMSMRLPAMTYSRLAAVTALRWLGIVPLGVLRAVAGSRGRAIFDAYQDADLVVSAPGGPYFGDIYRDHELAHWLFILMARASRVPSFLYATSAGPFQTPILNILRRRFFRLFDDLCVREERSAAHMRELTGIDIDITADSALQRTVPAMQRHDYFAADRQQLGEKFLVVTTALRHRFHEVDDGDARQRRYEEALLAAIRHVESRRDCHFLLLPQLYGAAKSDVPYLQALAERFPDGTSWELVDPSHDSDAHRGIVGMCDLSIACRYHPQIFASSGATPGVCIYYEHKARSHMESLGLGHLAFDIGSVEAAPLIAGIDEAIDRAEAISEQIRERRVALIERAGRTTEKACALLAAKVGAR